MRVTRTAAAAAAFLAAATGLSACGLGGTEKETVADKDSLVIGVKEDQPALGVKGPDGTYKGFDVDVATYIAGKLGVPKSRLTFKTANSSVREEVLANGTVDMVVATYSITAKRKMEVTFGGPYYVAHQDTFVSADDTTVNEVRDLKGKRICAVTGSNSWRRVIEERKVAAKPVTVGTYGACMDALAAGKLDAVSTDDLIVAGFAAGRPGRMINAPFTDEKYGVGIKKGDLKGCEEINRAITAMYQDGTAKRLLDKWFGDSGLKLTTSVPQFEGCK